MDNSEVVFGLFRDRRDESGTEKLVVALTFRGNRGGLCRRKSSFHAKVAKVSPSRKGRQIEFCDCLVPQWRAHPTSRR